MAEPPRCCGPVVLQDKVVEQHTAVHAFHHHIPHGTHRSSSGTGIIWLLIVLHVAFVGYWGERRAVAGARSIVSLRASCRQVLHGSQGCKSATGVAHPLLRPRPGPRLPAAWFWWTSRTKQREEKKGKSSVPQKVTCLYDWGSVPQISNIQLASKSAQH